MEYLDGQPLHAVFRKATRVGMPLDVHVRILAEVLAGLHYATSSATSTARRSRSSTAT